MPILAVLAVLIIILLGAGYYFTSVLIYPKVTPFDETRKTAVESGWVDETQYLPWPREEFQVQSPHGYHLSAVYHPQEGARRTVVITHGITFSLYGSVKYAMLFYKRGFNVLIYDLRHHGKSGGPNTSFGYYEKDDLKVMVDWAFERLGAGGIVGTLGESLGASTTLQHAGTDPRIAFAVADCSYSSMPELLAYRLRQDYHLPPFPLLTVANLITKAVAGWRFEEASPIAYVPHIEKPVLFVHGQNDNYILPEMSEALFAAKQRGYRLLYLAPNAGHAESLITNPVEYDRKIETFLQEIGLS
jgi:uncharacterized protein